MTCFITICLRCAWFEIMCLTNLFDVNDYFQDFSQPLFFKIFRPMKLCFDDVGDKFVEINQLINSPKIRPMEIVKIFDPIISLQFLTNGNFQHFVTLSTDHGTHFTNRDEICIFLSSLVVEQQINGSNSVIWVWFFQFQMNSFEIGTLVI